MDKVYVSNKVSPKTAKLFDALVEKVGPPKNSILEAAIEVFNALPLNIQLLLKCPTNGPERKKCLEKLRALTLD
ncbi:MAG: hypothetical protein ACYS74_16585 [Planctomycetota bacterium]|jgi:hypothetical protein